MGLRVSWASLQSAKAEVYVVTSSGATTQTKLNIIRNASTGTGQSLSFANETIIANKSRTSTSSGSTQNYSYYQYHINFDTSGVSSATDVKLHMYSKFSGVLTNGLNPSYGDYDGIRMKLIKSTINLYTDNTGLWGNIQGYISCI